MYRGLCELERKGCNLTPLSHHVWDLAHCHRGLLVRQRPTVGLCGMKPGFHLSCAFLVDSLVEMGVNQGRFIGGGAGGRSLRRLMLCVMWWRGGCAPASILLPSVTTAFSPGSQLWDLELEQRWWVWACYTQSMGCLVFLNFKCLIYKAVSWCCLKQDNKMKLFRLPSQTVRRWGV